jgi:hypothetical protein
MTEHERTVRRNELIRKICLWEIRTGNAAPGTYYEAVMWTHRPGGPREMVDKFCDGLAE